MFEHAKLKLQRADKHIEEFHSDVRKYIDENPHGVLIKFDPHQLCDVLQIFAPLKAIPQELALPIGDAIHNLHTALDFIWYEFVGLFDPAPSEYTKFPFRRTREQVAAAIKGKKIPARFKKVGDFVIDVVQPYEGSDTKLWGFHNLDITDKHEYLIPQIKVVTVRDVRAEDEDGTPIPLPALRSLIPGWPPATIRLGLRQNPKLTNYGNMTVNVLFYKGPLQGWPVESVLSQFSVNVTEIMEGFRALIENAEPL